MKQYYSSIFIAVLCIFVVFLPRNTHAQCLCSQDNFGSINADGMAIGETRTQGSVFAGERVFIANTTPGAVYRLSTCGASYDTQLTIYTSGCTFIGYNDDNGPACFGTRASINITSPGGDLYAVINEYDCEENMTFTTLFVTLISTSSAELLIQPYREITKCDFTLYDSGGPFGDYSNNEDYVIVIYPESPDQILTIEGNYAIENGWDFLSLVWGASSDATTISAEYTGNGSLSYTAPGPGMPITVKFRSDGSVTAPGFALDVSCSCSSPSSIAITAPDITECSSLSFIDIDDVFGNGGYPFVHTTFQDNTLPPSATISGDALVTSNLVLLTDAVNNQGGSIVFDNVNNVTGVQFISYFKMAAFGGTGADGLSFSFGPNISLNPPGSESGHGDGIRISFDSYNNGASFPNCNGINYQNVYLMYGTTVLGCYSLANYTGWRDREMLVVINVDQNGRITVRDADIASPIIFFSNVQLPQAYIDADKSNWRLAFSARTGGLNDIHNIDDVNMIFQNQYEFSIDGGDTWQTESLFQNLEADAYDVQVRNYQSTCGSLGGIITINTLPFADNLATLVEGETRVAYEVCEEDGWTYYASVDDPDEYVFGIQKNGNICELEIEIVDLPGVQTYASTGGAGPSRGTFLIGRHWNISLLSGSISDPVSVRYFVDPAEIDQAQSEALDLLATTALPGSSITPLTFFKAPVPFNPGLVVDGDFAFTPTNTWILPPSGQLNGVTYYELGGITSFSGGTGGFSVNDDASLLPVSWLSFTATAVDNTKVRLDWSTATEIQNLGFSIERSADGIHFEAIGWHDGNGTTSHISSYMWYDFEPFVGTNYYRLQQMDEDGGYEYSSIASAHIRDSDMHRVWAVHNEGQFDLYVQTPESDIFLEIFDMSGKRLHARSHSEKNIHIDNALYASGLYIVKITFNEYTHTALKVIKY